MNRKIIAAVLLIAVMVGGLNVRMLVKAQDNSDSESYIQLDVDYSSDEEKYYQANEELICLGATVTKMRTNKFLDVTKYYQSGQTWSNDIMKEKNLTIGSAGCCLTSFSMIQRYLGGTLNPGEVNSKLGNYACLFNYDGAASTFGYKIQNKVHKEVGDDTAIDFIAGAIEKNYPVLVGLEKDDGSGTHFVCAFGYNGRNVYIHDPASGRDYTQLSQYLKNYHVNRLYVYSK